MSIAVRMPAKISVGFRVGTSTVKLGAGAVNSGVQRGRLRRSVRVSNFTGFEEGPPSSEGWRGATPGESE